MATDSFIEDVDKLISRFSDDASHQDIEEMTNEKEQNVINMFAPPGFEESFKQLYSILYPCLSSSSESPQQQLAMAASAILIGARGCGKNRLLNSCLAACHFRNPGLKVRKVAINGIVCRGSDVSAVVYEIIRQLSELAFQETKSNQPSSEQPSKRRRMAEENEKHLLRLRKSSFTSNLALLESTLKIAAIDNIPILLVLDELDSFADEGERQVLLYHLLDRVATPGSSLCLVGMTSKYQLLGILEKRVRSRAEGVSKVIFLNPANTYDQIVNIIKCKLDGNENVSQRILRFISKPTLSQKKDDLHAKIWSTLERQFRLGKDFRWFSRVISTALSFYRQDVDMEDAPLVFKAQYLLDALVLQGSSISMPSDTKQKNLCMIRDQAIDPRLQAILDMSKPQVALLLAAKRILTREAHREQAVVAPLTIERMLKEYESSFRKRATHKKESTLLPAAHQLLERGLLAPSLDHSGGGPMQYNITHVYKTLDPYSLMRLPLHMPIEVEKELGEALTQNLLDCSTGLREWGRKIN